MLVTAPEELRVKRVMEDNKVSQGVAREMVERDADTKTRFVRRYYGENWGDEGSYDLVVDTSDLSEDDAAQRIIGAAQSWFRSSDGPRAAELEVDRVLLETIDARFGRTPADQS